MTSPSELEPLRKVWKALETHGPSRGWSTLEVWRTPSVRLLAGRMFPEGVESLLVGLPGLEIPSGIQLPAGRGFELLRPGSEGIVEGTGLLALVRKPAGSVDLFSLVAEDVAGLLRSLDAAGTRSILTALVERVRAWQAFMERERPEALSREAELGLVGELFLLEEMLGSGVMAEEAVRAWQGPLGALQDFQFAAGAIEVKATCQPVAFPATIHSLDQLDHLQVPLLFLVGARVALDANGATLPGIAGRIRELLPVGLVQTAMASRLIHAGLHPGMEEACTRRYAPVGMEILQVREGFPALNRSAVPAAVTDAEYILDLARIESPRILLPNVLRTLGVL